MDVNMQLGNRMRSSIIPARNPPTPGDAFALIVMAEKRDLLVVSLQQFRFHPHYRQPYEGKEYRR